MPDDSSSANTIGAHLNPGAAPDKAAPAFRKPAVPGAGERLLVLAELLTKKTGSSIRADSGMVNFAIPSGEQVRCELQPSGGMMISVAAMDLTRDKAAEVALFLLNANALGKATAGGWLAYDIVSERLLFHYVWGNFMAAGPDDFIPVIESAIRVSKQYADMIRSGEWSNAVAAVTDN